MLLPRCGHSFCRPCVTLLLSANCIICPTCRTDQRVESAHRLPTEFTLLAIIAAQENSKLDNCRRHDVKLSFWCKTCGQPTCGECLFEDHPTHSHDVIRSITYVQNIKDSVHDIACKFMEALDTREQSYYRTVYTCARRIDEVLRNVTVLRKDMGEAQQLMKGIKEEDTSISTATSLAEAAKYLGLKWNIQDANFNRTQKEASERDKKVSSSEDKDDGKNEKPTKKKKKSLASQELKTDESKGEEELKKEEFVPDPVAPAFAEVEPSKDVKKKSTLRKSKTLSVFEPFSMDREITDIKEKIVELDNRERERIEVENLKRIEEEEQEELDKKEVENRELEAEKATEEVLAKVDAISKAKEAELKKKLELEEEEAKKKAAELEEKNKAADKELERLNQILKKPRGRLARKYLAEKEKVEAELALLNPTKKGDDNVKESTEKESTDTEGDAGKEKTNGEPEHKDKEDKEVKEVDEAKGGTSEDDAYAGELTLEEKEAKELAESKQGEESGSSLFEFMKEPLFTVCVEGAEGRLALLRWEPRGLHIYCHQYQQLDYDIAIKSTVLQALIPSKSPLVFLELSVGNGRPRRIYIRLWGHMRRAHNFMALCIGDQGSAFLNTKLLQTYNLNEPGERILGGDHEYNCGRGGCALLDDLEWNGDYAQPMREGLLAAAGSGQHATNSLFLICTNSDTSRNFSCPFGEVVYGLEDVGDSVRKAANKEEEIWITECGVVLEPPRLG